MTISEVIERLEEIKNEYGDLCCYTNAQGEELSEVCVCNEDNCVLRNKFKESGVRNKKNSDEIFLDVINKRL